MWRSSRAESGGVCADRPASAWFRGVVLVDGGGGALFTITLCEDRAGAEASVSAAADWVPDNVGDLVEGSPAVMNGEVRAQA